MRFLALLPMRARATSRRRRSAGNSPGNPEEVGGVLAAKSGTRAAGGGPEAVGRRRDPAAAKGMLGGRFREGMPARMRIEPGGSQRIAVSSVDSQGLYRLRELYGFPDFGAD